jgi:hypothetical protein
MFGLTSLVYVRDYVQGLQSQRSPSACAQEIDELCARDYLGVCELPELKGRNQIKENSVVKALSTKLGSSVTRKSTSPRNHTNTALGFLDLGQGKSCFQNHIGLVSNDNGWNSPHSFCDLTYTNRSQKTVAYSERDCSLTHDRGSKSQRTSSANSKETVIKFIAFGAFTQTQPLPQKHLPHLPTSPRNSDRISTTIAQSGSKLRRLSPLRESSGNIHRSTEIEQQSLSKSSSFMRSNSNS